MSENLTFVEKIKLAIVLTRDWFYWNFNWKPRTAWLLWRTNRILKKSEKFIRESQKKLPSEFEDIINKNFWDLI